MIPWKAKYSRSKKPHNKKCPFCNPEKSLVIWEGKNVYVLLNKYPYNVGHLMVIPYRHIDSILALNDDELREMWIAIKTSIQALKEAYNVDSFNIGVNIGPYSGGSVTHVHVHVVPRYKQELNFIDIISATRVLIENVETTAKKLRSIIENIMRK